MTEPSAAAERILVVDDDRSFLDLVADALARAGFECAKARSGEEALSLALATPPRAAIVDGLLPGMRGDELVRRLREYFPPEKLPILFVSAFFRDLRSYRRLSGELAVNRVLHKPIDVEQLLSALDETLAAGSAEEPGEEELSVEVHVDFSADVAELLPEYLQASRARVAAMRTALRQLGGAEEEVGREVLRAESHKLHGSGASFGLPEISRLAGVIERLVLEAARPFVPTARARLSGLVQALDQKLCAAAGERPIAAGVAPAPAARLVLVDGPTALADSCRQAAAAGADLAVFREATAALEALRRPEEATGLVVVAGDRPEIDAPGLCARLRAEGIGPLAVLSDDGSLEARLRAVGARAPLWLPRLPDAASLLAAAETLAPTAAGFQVLAVDEDPQRLARLAPAFALRQLALQPCIDPAELFDALAPNEAGLVLVGPNLSRCGQLELVRALRADARFAALPLLVVAGEADGGAARWSERQLEALGAGADLLVEASVRDEALAAEARSLADRGATRRRATLRDPLTGAWLRPWLEQTCRLSLGLARRAGRVLSLLVFEFDAEPLARRCDGASCNAVALALASQLRTAFRSTDLIARLGPGRFAVLLHDVASERARAMLEEQRQAFGRRSFGAAEPAAIALRAGLASLPETDGDGASFVRAAEATLSA